MFNILRSITYLFLSSVTINIKGKIRKSDLSVNWIYTCVDGITKFTFTDGLTQYGCSKIFHDKMSGAKRQRPGLEEALQYAREGDTIVVWR